MATKQPQWRLAANLGDVNPLEYGGYFIYTDRTKVYPPEGEMIIAAEESDQQPQWTTYRFILEPCTFENGILSDNKFHPEMPAWFADSIPNMAAFVGMAEIELIRLFLSENPIDRAQAWRTVGDYHGFDNLDSYPRTYNKRSELPRRLKRNRV